MYCVTVYQMYCATKSYIHVLIYSSCAGQSVFFVAVVGLLTLLGPCLWFCVNWFKSPAKHYTRHCRLCATKTYFDCLTAAKTRAPTIAMLIQLCVHAAAMIALASALQMEIWPNAGQGKDFTVCEYSGHLATNSFESS